MSRPAPRPGPLPSAQRSLAGSWFSLVPSIEVFGMELAPWEPWGVLCRLPAANASLPPHLAVYLRFQLFKNPSSYLSLQHLSPYLVHMLMRMFY